MSALDDYLNAHKLRMFVRSPEGKSVPAADAGYEKATAELAALRAACEQARTACRYVKTSPTTTLSLENWEAVEAALKELDEVLK